MLTKKRVAEIIEHAASSPAVALDSGAGLVEKGLHKMVAKVTTKKIASYWNVLGPGLITGAADDDPSGIATYSQQGAQYGLQLLWLAPFTFPLMSIVQEMCARIGLSTGRGLAGNIRKYYPTWVIYSVTMLLFIANTLNLGADLGAMAKAVQLLNPSLNFYFLVIAFSVATLLLLIFLSYRVYAQYLKYLAFILFAYVFSALSIEGIDWAQVFWHTVIPSLTLSPQQILLITGILGTTISPYLFFWQTSLENEEQILKGETTIKDRQESITDRGIRRMRADVWAGMFISNLVMFFIVVSCAETLYKNGITNIVTAADAAAALKPIAGEYAYLLFSIGIIGSGLLAVPVLAGSASYALSESMRWKLGLYKKLKEASAFYGVIIISMVIGMLINFIGFDPMKALLYSAVVNGIVAPIILFFIVRISSNKTIMNGRSNHPVVTKIGWFTTGMMGVVAVAAIISMLFFS